MIDTLKSLSLCYYHDVKTCKSIDISAVPPIAPSNQRYLSPPTFVVKEWTLTFAAGDQLLYLPNNTDCNKMSQALAKINFTSVS
jgi:hypothetical protein